MCGGEESGRLVCLPKYTKVRIIHECMVLEVDEKGD